MDKHDHQHRCVCEHDRVKYCASCKTVYCQDCKQEWVARPVSVYPNPYLQQYSANLALGQASRGSWLQVACAETHS